MNFIFKAVVATITSQNILLHHTSEQAFTPTKLDG